MFRFIAVFAHESTASKNQRHKLAASKKAFARQRVELFWERCSRSRLQYRVWWIGCLAEQLGMALPSCLALYLERAKPTTRMPLKIERCHGSRISVSKQLS